jgi:hypothetical protein
LQPANSNADTKPTVRSHVTPTLACCRYAYIPRTTFRSRKQSNDALPRWSTVTGAAINAIKSTAAALVKLARSATKRALQGLE